MKSAPPSIVRYPEGQSGDYRVTIKISNARLWNAIQKAGFSSLPAFCRARGLSYNVIVKYLALSYAPVMPDGTIRPSAQRLADELFCSVEDIFPPAMLRNTLENRIVIADISENAVRAIVSRDMSPEGKIAIEDGNAALRKSLETLSPRHKTILEMRYGLNDGKERTLKEIADTIGVTQERVRQGQLQAERKLLHPSRAIGLKEHFDAMTIARDE